MLIKKYRILLAKNLLLLLIYFGVFLYDFHVGKWAGVYLYYFAFFFVAINIFSWKKEKFWLLLHLLLPIILIVVSELHILNTKEINYTNTNTTSAIYVFNFCMTFLIIAVNAFLDGNVGFMQMSEVVEYTMENSLYSPSPDLDFLESTDANARETAVSFINKLHKKR